MLVQRIRCSRVIPHRVDVNHAITLTCAVSRACAFAEAKVHLICLTLQVVINAFIPPTEIVALGGSIRGREMPMPSLHGFPLTKKSFEFYRQAHNGCCNLQLSQRLSKLERRQRKTFQVEAISPL